ncbi:MAG: thioredoxin fold domain-containing protein [Phycisphaerales bacterium]|nr:MAG: thioredoxin fold domain-containing protein [Phycisphaerales bacterium]
MKNTATIAALVILFAPALSLGSAKEKDAADGKTIAALYPDLTSGALTFARTAKLPEGVLLRCGEVEVKAADIDKFIQAQSEQMREEFRKNAFFLVEQQATVKLVVQLAKKTLAAGDPNLDGKADGQIIQDYLEKHVLKDVRVSDAEAEKFYNENKAMFGGASLAQVREQLKRYLLGEKNQQVVSAHIRELGKKMDIRVAGAWLKRQAVLAKDNPVDKARGSGKPSLVDFGATGCRPCDMLAPILEEVKAKYAGKVNVVFVHTGRHPILASRYGIQAIPVQIFYDKSGKEVFRHVGFFPQDEIEKKLLEMGVK